MHSLVIDNATIFADVEKRASAVARLATNIAEYSPYADLRDAMRKAMDAMRDIDSLPADVRERLEGGSK